MQPNQMTPSEVQSVWCDIREGGIILAAFVLTPIIGGLIAYWVA